MRERSRVRTLPWQPPLASETRIRRQGILVAALTGLAFSCAGILCQKAIPIAPRLLWNASRSLPVGLYSMAPYRPIMRGDLLVVRLSGSVARLADERQYLPLHVPLLKPVAALSGSRICAKGTAISIDGRVVAIRYRRDRSGRPMPWWNGCERLGDGRLFLLSPVADSFDSRYFGAVDASAIIGLARPVWTPVLIAPQS